MVEDNVVIENIEIKLDEIYYFPVRIEKVRDPDCKGYIAENVAIKGVATQARTLEGVRKRIKEATEEMLESYKRKSVV